MNFNKKILKKHLNQVLKTSWLVRLEDRDSCLVPNPFSNRGWKVTQKELRFSWQKIQLNFNIFLAQKFLGFVSDCCVRQKELAELNEKGMGGDLIGSIYSIKRRKWTSKKLQIRYWNKKYSEQMFLCHDCGFQEYAPNASQAKAIIFSFLENTASFLNARLALQRSDWLGEQEIMGRCQLLFATGG